MARQLEDPQPALDLPDEIPMLTAIEPRGLDRPQRLDPADKLDRSIEDLRIALDLAEKRWRQLEHRLEEQDRAIRALQGELRLSGNRRGDYRHQATAPVPELTEIVRSESGAATDADPETPAPGADPIGTRGQ